jgi:cyanobactin maturation PatA/PatG family protease
MTAVTGTIPGLEKLWAETLGDPGICLAVLDGPVDQSHPSLRFARLSQIPTLISGSIEPGPAGQHGTHVASIIFGQHTGPVKGIASRCRGLIVPIFNNGDYGSIAPCSQIDLVRAITQAVQAGAQVINISGGEHSFSGMAHPLLANAIRRCVEQGVLIVAAAGNEGCECLHIPGALPAVLAVGAMDAQNRPLRFSNYGRAYRTQGILAPGEDILGAVPGGGTNLQSGTSYATAIVSGVAALLLSLQRKLGQKPDAQIVRAALLETAHACDPTTVPECRPFLAGRLNIPGAHSTVAKASREIKGSQVTAGAAAIQHGQSGQHNTKAGLRAGDMAPAFSVKDHTGRLVQLSDYLGRTVVLWFYPEADTPG